MSRNPAQADSLAPDSVAPLLSGRFGAPYIYAETCASTQLLLSPTLPEGALAVCDVQTRGRGRLGRRWEAPPGTAILCSVLLRPPAARNPAEVSLVGGLATAEAVEEATGLGAGLKWPNDVLLAGRKVAGVLAELRDGAIVLGVGLNVNQSEDQLPAGAILPPGSLLLADGVRRDRAPLLARLLARLEPAYEAWRLHGLVALREGLAARDALRGRHVLVDGEPALAVGIDAQGRLAVEAGGVRRVVASGEVRLLPG